MLEIKSFTFNPYQENTYILIDEKRNCAIVDPGCYSQTEQQALVAFIKENELSPLYLLNTHGHIDHMLGNRFVVDEFQVPFLTHRGVIAELEHAESYGPLFGLNPSPSPKPDKLVDEGDIIELGSEKLKVIFTPGHAAGHISFYHEASMNILSGDVLFKGSIGRTDLPGGDYPTLMETIFNKFLPLADNVVVHPGHGPTTTVGEEKRSNPFILDWQKKQNLS
ncbi:MAG: MBL fold metallo-hydrolase [Bacteroidia bacterium]|nr:MBL fold metallo-hydrolase [Bacteroidia bacterium]